MCYETDKKTLDRLKVDILKLESENIKERKHTKQQMLDKIRAKIEEEVNKQCF